MRLPAITYYRPASLKEALEVLSQEGDRAVAMGGGTALVVSLRQRLAKKDFIVDIGHLRELRHIEQRDGYIEIGSAATLEMVASSETVRLKAPPLAQAASKVASPQVRNTATVGGNICLDTRCCYYNRSEQWRTHLAECFKLSGEMCNAASGARACQSIFSADLPPALAALEAAVVVEKTGGEMIIPMLGLYSGKGENPIALAPGQIVTRIRIPVTNGNLSSAYCKLTNREAVDYPLLSVAVALRFRANGKALEEARIVISAVSSSPKRIVEAERVLLEKGLSSEAVEAAAEAACGQARPIDNAAELSAAYRKKMARVYAARAIREACRQAGAG